MRAVVRILVLFFCASVAHATEGVPAARDGIDVALHLATTRHPAVMSKREELKALGFELESAEFQRFPILSVSATTTDDISGSSPDTDDQYDRVIAVVRQPLWVGGRIQGAIGQARVKQEIGRLSLLAVQRDLMESTVAAYAGVQGARQRLDAAELNVREHERLSSLITRREEGGIASLADVQLASSRLSQALAQKIQIEATMQRALNDLLALTQQPLPATRQVPAELTELPPLERIAGEIEKTSATVQQRLLEVDLARVSVDLATAELLPRLYAKLEQDIYTSSERGEDPEGTRVGLVLEGAVEGMGVSGWKKVKSSDARVVAARQNVESARNDLRRRVQALLTDLQSLQQVLQSNEMLVQSTELTLASFMRQFDAGRRSWVDVMNSQREMSDARLAQEQTRSSLLETKLRLAVQLGQFDQQAGALP